MSRFVGRASLLVIASLVSVAASLGAQQRAGASAMQPSSSGDPTAADSAGIRQAALDYIDGWYTGDADRMTRALHPELAKRIINTDPQSGRSRLGSMSAMTLVEGTRSGGGKRTPVDQRREEIRILDIFRGAAVARVDADEWVDYLQLGRWNGRWVIVNVLWELRK